MKLKITKGTIETILWLLGQLITLMKQVSKDNKGSEIGEVFNKSADAFLDARYGMLIIKKDKMYQDNGKEKNEENTKGN